MSNSDEILKLVVKSASDKRAHNIVALNMRKIGVLADYFVIMDASNSRQVKAIANSVIDQSKKNHVDVLDVEGMSTAKWILIDLGGVIVHVFKHETRDFYDLEKLWSDAPNVDVSKWEK
ncbi:ribosome silencing factor [Acetilactobacillus jinshanensis]|uniref:Ribosomal silencing factor RsfS n=1 Tax=Acetilactobacillus jinshanensis TaxID=1720083 RepID=A0A4P6ZLM6_9LACO|nr:ribosome silencing factor [Acetilactobacillus jinshanensis]QBP18664.1 ribosome silencing factor [Acetilactobacillus jinshanensis]URL61540.1 ribosome silencing factor [uncultured bacterium]